MCNRTSQKTFADALGYKKGEAFVVAVEGSPLLQSHNVVTVYDLADGVIKSEVVPLSQSLACKMVWE